MPNLALLRLQLNRLEILNVFSVEKHVSNGSGFLVNFVGMTGQDDTFCNDSLRLTTDQGAITDKADWQVRVVIFLFEDQHRCCGAKSNRHINAPNIHLPRA